MSHSINSDVSFELNCVANRSLKYIATSRGHFGIQTHKIHPNNVMKVRDLGSLLFSWLSNMNLISLIMRSKRVLFAIRSICSFTAFGWILINSKHCNVFQLVIKCITFLIMIWLEWTALCYLEIFRRIFITPYQHARCRPIAITEIEISSGNLKSLIIQKHSYFLCFLHFIFQLFAIPYWRAVEAFIRTTKLAYMPLFCCRVSMLVGRTSFCAR